MGTWYCEHCSAILPSGEYENPEQQQTASENLARAAELYVARLDVKWVFRHFRGQITRQVAANHEIRNKFKRATRLGYQCITQRFDQDADFKSSQEEMGRTRATMMDFDRIAQIPSQVHGIPFEERQRRFGQRPMLVLTGLGANTHDIREAPNYQEMMDQGPPQRPPSPQPQPRKGKGRGRTQSDPTSSRRRTSQQSEQWQYSSWKQRRY